MLPLRRFCPKQLSFSALVIGLVAPDFGYAFNLRGSFRRLIAAVFGQPASAWLANHGIRSWDGLSHSLLGSVAFCLPLGLLRSTAFRLVRPSPVATLPNPHRDLLEPFCRRPRHSVLAWSVSMLIGSYSHLAWDSLAKDDWWLAKTWPFLQQDLREAGSAHLAVYRAIWIISSVGGMLFLGVAYGRFLKRGGRKF